MNAMNPSMAYSDGFIQFMDANPTVYHATREFATLLSKAGFTELYEAAAWKIRAGGKYFVERNGSSMVAFVVGTDYKAGNGFVGVAGHADALTLKVKPNSHVDSGSKFLQVGVAPYSGGGSHTWLDRDLGLAGRVMVRTSQGYETRLVRLPGAIGRIASLAEHFGLSTLQYNKETQINPIVGQSDKQTSEGSHSTELKAAVCRAAGVNDEDLLGWELEFFDSQPATYLGLESEFISVGRCDDKLCSWAAIVALSEASTDGSLVKVAATFDNEEIGSLSLQGAKSNFLPATITRAFEALGCTSRNDCGRAFASSFLVSSDVAHAFNPNYADAYEAHQRPELNVGPVIKIAPTMAYTSELTSIALSRLVASKCEMDMQTFQVRSDIGGGGTIGPILCANMGVRTVEIGLAQLSMHSVRALTGTREPELGVRYFGGVYEYFEGVRTQVTTE